MAIAFTIAQPLTALAQNAVPTGTATHPLVWKYQWKDGNKANTIGSIKNNSPLPTPLATLPSGGYSPANIANAYGYTLMPAAGNGAGQIIAIIDAYGSTNIQTDLDTFCAQFGIPSTIVHISTPSGAPSSVNSGWATETTLDVEWAHSLAPSARIELVVAPTASFIDLGNAIKYAVNTLHANIVSMSFGGAESSANITFFNGIFTNNSVAYVASSGDNGQVTGVSNVFVQVPASHTNVLSVGGTSLNYTNVTVPGAIVSEIVWNNANGNATGGGISTVVTKPSFQNSWNTNSMRGVPDVSAVADPYTGGYIYFTDPVSGASGWSTIGGTSWSAPQWAALLACRASLGKATISTISTQLYSQARAPGATNYSNTFYDITYGDNIINGVGVSAAVGYDYCSGLGSPHANVIADPTATPAPTPIPTPTPPPPILRQWGFTPGAIPSIATNGGVKQISLNANNYQNSAVLNGTGRVVVWGSGSCTNIPAEALSGVSAISLGYTHMMALKNGGVIAWGSTTGGATVVPSLATNGIVAISAGFWDCLALTTDGTVIAWGDKYNGTTRYHAASAIIAFVNSTAAANKVIGVADGNNQGMVLRADGTIVAFGNAFNNSAQSADTEVPAGLTGVTAIAEGDSFALALKNNGTVVAWGNNSSGQLDVPPGLGGVVAISAGGSHALALKSDGTVVSWGFNAGSVLTVPGGLSGITAVEGGSYFSMSSTQGVGDSQTSGGGGQGGGGGGGGGPRPTPTPRPTPISRGGTGVGGGGSGGGSTRTSSSTSSGRSAPAPRSAPSSR